MRTIITKYGALIAVAALAALAAAAASCALLGGGNEGSMTRAAADLRRLSNAVQGEVWRGAAPDEDLMALACGRDHALCAALAQYSLQVKREGDEALLLLCAKDESRALLEDAACTPEIDFNPWEKGQLPCRFTLNAAEVCK